MGGMYVLTDSTSTITRAHLSIDTSFISSIVLGHPSSDIYYSYFYRLSSKSCSSFQCNVCQHEKHHCVSFPFRYMSSSNVLF